MQLVPIRKKYVYEKLERIDRSTGRVYKAWNFDIPMPSVTTILDSTKDKTHLKQWAASVGEEEAERIRNEAAIVGTHMHNVVERLLLNRDLGVPRTWLAVRGYRMGYALVEHFFPHVDEVWGTEVPLYVPNTYAGTSDCVGIYKGKPSIIGNGVVVDPWHLVGEIEKIAAQGVAISPDILTIADNAIDHACGMQPCGADWFAFDQDFGGELARQ